jgi:uncharacterized protein YjlB
LLVYPVLIEADPPGLEALFDRNHWPAAWQNGVCVHHFHTQREVSASTAGGTVQFGGDTGVTVTAKPGDVIVLPAGTGHKKLSSRGALGIVGAYPQGQHPDMCTPLLSNLERTAQAVERVPLPDRDPVYGAGGPLFTHWEAG